MDKTQIAIKRTFHFVGKPANTQHAPLSNSATSENTHLKNYVFIYLNSWNLFLLNNRYM